jgi:hypothetical protein
MINVMEKGWTRGKMEDIHFPIIRCSLLLFNVQASSGWRRVHALI